MPTLTHPPAPVLNGNGNGIQPVPRNSREAAALAMLAVGITPVQLGTADRFLKIPVNNGWQSATITQSDVQTWFATKPKTNIGALGGKNTLSPDLYLARLDFDVNADSIFPAFKSKLGNLYERMALSKTRQGWHVWFNAPFPLQNKTVAGRWDKNAKGKRQAVKYIEFKAEGGQVVAPGSLHPSGHIYTWEQGGWDSIPALTEAEVKMLINVCQLFDEGAGSKTIHLPSDPPPPPPRKPRYKPTQYGTSDDPREMIREKFDLLDYAQSHMVYDDLTVQRRRTQLGGNGGFFIYDDNHFYCFADGVGGDCFDLVGYLEHGAGWFDDKSSRFRDVLKLAALYTNVEIAKNHSLLTGKEDKDFINVANPKTKDFWMALKKLGYDVRVNELLMHVEVNGKPANDFTEARMVNRLNDMGLSGIGRMQRAWMDMAYHNRYHPVKTYFEGLPSWDGVDRIGDFVETYIKDAHGFAETVFKAWMVGAVSRAFEGTQNYVMVWAGTQKKGKSTLAEWLSPLKPLHIEKTISEKNWKDNERRACSYFTWEWPEAQHIFRKPDLIEPLKGMLTSHVLTVRLTYDKLDTAHTNLANHIATLNDDGVGFFADKTGNRRYATLDIEHIDFDYKKNVNIDDLWTQAYGMYLAEYNFTFDEGQERLQTQINKSHAMEPVLDSLFFQNISVVDKPEPVDFLQLMEVLDILYMNGLSRHNQQDSIDNLKRLLTSLGYKHTTRLSLPYTKRRPRGYFGLVAKREAVQREYRAADLSEWGKLQETGEIAE